MGKKEIHNRFRKQMWYIGVGFGLFLLFFTGLQYQQRLSLQRELAGKILRFHVLANSDSAADQALKYQVRDAVGEKMSRLLKDAEDQTGSEHIIEANMEEIIHTAEQTVAEEGYDYEVNAFLSQVDFPVKSYGAYTFPAGRYKALEVVIGDGAGENWWCVMYPNMCFSGSIYEVTDEAEEALREVLSPEEYEAVLQSGEYQVRFKFLRFLEYLR